MSEDWWAHHEEAAIGLLGPLLVRRDGLRRELPRSRKTRGLLAYLTLAKRVCRRDDLCELLWEGVGDPRGELRWSLAKIRAAVGPWLKISSDGVALECATVPVDAFAFRASVGNSLSERAIVDVLAIWRGRPLADIEVQGQPAFHAWLAAERDSLVALHIDLLKAAVDVAWARPIDALAAARRLVAEEPWNEWGHARVVQLLQRCGRIADAREYLAATSRSLSRELGVPVGGLLTPPAPPRAQVMSTDSSQVQRRAARCTVRLEPLKIAPGDSDSCWKVGIKVASGIGERLWRTGTFDVLDGEQTRIPSLSDGVYADFAVRGAVVELKGATQISLRCINLSLGKVVWSGHLDGGSSPATMLPLWIKKTADAIGAQILVSARGTTNFSSVRTRLIKARCLAEALEPEANGQALDLLKEILSEDADEPEALALIAWSYSQRAVYNWSANADTDRAEAKYCAAAATRVGIDDSEHLATIAAARTLLGDRNGAEVLLDRALRLDAEAPTARMRSGWLANYGDEPARALGHFRAAIRLAPLSLNSFNALTGRGVAHFIRGDYRRAIRGMEQALALNPKAVWIYRNLVPAYEAAGDRQKAAEGMRALVNTYPRLTVAEVSSALVFSPAVMTKIAKGLCSAGLPRA